MAIAKRSASSSSSVKGSSKSHKSGHKSAKPHKVAKEVVKAVVKAVKAAKPSSTPKTKSTPKPTLATPAVKLPIAKRHQRKVRDPMNGITNPVLQRIGRREGVRRIRGAVYQAIREQGFSWLESIVNDAVICAHHRHVKTLTPSDFAFAFRRHGRVLY